MPKHIFILSDIHLGAGLPTDWFDPDTHQKPLLDTLEKIRKVKTDHPDRDVELVIAGDLVDTWVCPMKTKPPTPGDILDHNPEIVNSIRECVDALDQVFYLLGNHDMEIMPTDIDKLNTRNNQVILHREYRSGLMKVEHGHRFAMVNAPDVLNDPRFGLPLGYFVARMVTGHPDYFSPGAIFGYIDDLLEAAVTTETIAESMVEALMEHTGRKPDDEFIMPGKRTNITIAKVQNKYKDLFTQWVNKYGYWYSLNAIRAELGDLGWFADRLCNQHGYRVVVMGHSHHACYDKDTFLVNDRIYANSGAWVDQKETPSYVEVIKDNGYQVNVWRMREDGSFWLPEDESGHV